MVRKSTEGNDFGQITAIIRRQGMKRVSFSFLSKTVLDSESQAMDSRFQVLDSGFFFFSGTSILDSIFSGRGGSRGRVQGVRTPPEMTCGFLIQLVFCQKKKLCGLLVLK